MTSLGLTCYGTYYYFKDDIKSLCLRTTNLVNQKLSITESLENLIFKKQDDKDDRSMWRDQWYYWPLVCTTVTMRRIFYLQDQDGISSPLSLIGSGFWVGAGGATLTGALIATVEFVQLFKTFIVETSECCVIARRAFFFPLLVGPYAVLLCAGCASIAAGLFRSWCTAQIIWNGKTDMMSVFPSYPDSLDDMGEHE